MADISRQWGSRKVEPPKKSRSRKAKRARDARRLVQRIEEARTDRRVAWPEGQPEFAAERQEQRLSDLHGEKRAMRRDIYSEAPVLEGEPFYKGQPGGRS